MTADLFWSAHPELAITNHQDLINSECLPNKWKYIFDESAGIPLWYEIETGEEITKVEEAKKEFKWTAAQYKVIKEEIERRQKFHEQNKLGLIDDADERLKRRPSLSTRKPHDSKPLPLDAEGKRQYMPPDARIIAQPAKSVMSDDQPPEPLPDIGALALKEDEGVPDPNKIYAVDIFGDRIEVPAKQPELWENTDYNAGKQFFASRLRKQPKFVETEAYKRYPALRKAPRPWKCNREKLTDSQRLIDAALSRQLG